VVRTDDREAHEILCATGDLLSATLAVYSEHTVVAGHIQHSIGGVHPKAVNVLECRLDRLVRIAARPARGDQRHGYRQRYDDPAS
jgi:hypothetical protein